MGSVLRAAALAAGCAVLGSALAGPLDALLGRGEDATPAPEQVFLMRAVGGARPRLELDIADGYYLYRDKLRVTRADGRPVTLDLPPGQPMQDAHFGTVDVLRGRISAPVTLPAATESITVDYQGCAQDRLCYAPARRILAMDPA